MFVLALGFVEGILAGLVGAVVGAVALLLGQRFTAGGVVSRAKREGDQIIQTATAEGEAVKQRVELEAERRAAKRREEADREIAEAMADIKADQARLAKRDEALDKRLEKATDRESSLDRRDEGLKLAEAESAGVRAELDRQHEHLKVQLQQVAGMTEEQAHEQFMAEIRIEAEHDGHALTQSILEEAELEARQRSREITLQAIQRYAAEHVADSTVRSVRIPSDDMKGRIIGREGRNIRALERATGVDILVDDTPGVIAVSCFDPIRRAIAGEALAKLVADGRVHPSRIEEIVEGVRKDMSERIIKHGNDSVMESNIRGLNPKIVEAMGKLHFRTSYGQNVLRHSMEVAYLSQIIADQLGLNGQIARRCGFLHDIGKAMDHEMEGGHPAIGMEFCRKYGEKSDAVLNAIGGHHGDIPATTPYTPIVMAADAISGARPGARRESMEMYIKRLEQLEGIAKEQPNVDEAHAIQAGREVRVIVDAKRADDTEAFNIAKNIAKRVEEEMTFPGEIKVTVLREVRAEAIALTGTPNPANPNPADPTTPMAIKATEVKRGQALMYEGSLHVVLDTDHVKPGKGPAYVQAKMKNIETGTIKTNRFNSTDKLEDVSIDRRQMQYLYDGSGHGAGPFVFMDNDTFDQIEIASDVITNDISQWLKENQEVAVQIFDGRPLGVELPAAIELTITETTPQVKGATATNQLKEATVETGARVRVPPFIEQGQVIKINPTTGEYLGKA